MERAGFLHVILFNSITMKEHELIEKYLEGSLPESERIQFEHRVNTDECLRSELQQRRMVEQLWVKESVKRTTQDRVKRIMEEGNAGTFNKTYWLAAASVVLILGISAFFFFQTPPVKGPEYARGENKGNVRPGDGTITGKTLNINKYAAVDSVNTIKFYPVDHTIFHRTDTITFSWPAEMNSQKLIISGSESKQTLVIELDRNKASFKLPLVHFAPGEYKWHLAENDSMQSFTVQ